MHKPPQETVLTKIVLDNGTTSPILDPKRPALVVSSTSWTADEDFSLLITALDKYQATPNVPQLLVIISGVGPLRSQFEKTVKEREESGRWTKVAASCIWVEAKDYPVLLGSADFGVSLHASSSGRDLPMKVVDMFGCGLPVLAKSFPCIAELVRDGKNGRVFDTGEELGDQMVVCLSGSYRPGRH
jgi:beta-1,4-mannosyltransferase